MAKDNDLTQTDISVKKSAEAAKNDALEIIERCYDGELGEAMASLTEKQKLFALHLANPDNTKTNAARLAGYGYKNANIQASKLLRTTGGAKGALILKCKELFRQKLLAETGLTQTYYRTKLINIAEANQVDNPQVSISALKLLGESAGFTGSSKSGGTNISINISGLPDLGSDCIEVN